MKSKATPSKKSFFTSVLSFFYNPAAYQTVAKQSFSKAFDQLLILMTLVSFTLIIVAGVGLWKLRETVQNELPKFEGSLPDDISVSIHDGIFESNLPQPYFIPQEPFTNHDSVKGTTPTYLFTIDTQTPFSLEQMEEYNSIVWLTKDRVYVSQSNGDLQYFAYPEKLDQAFDKTDLQNLPRLAWTVAKFPLMFGAIFFFIGMVFATALGIMIYLAFVSFVWFFLSLLFGAKKEFATCYKLSISALRPTLFVFGLLALLFAVTPLEMPNFVITVLLIFFLAVNRCFSRSLTETSAL